MTPEQWKACIIGALSDIGDVELQEEAWSGKGNKISSFVEVYEVLMDDFIFDEFIQSEEVGLSDRQRAAAILFARVFDRYFDKMSDNGHSAILRDPEWEAIRGMARNLVRTLNEA